jgi:hypothetical protein
MLGWSGNALLLQNPKLLTIKYVQLGHSSFETEIAVEKLRVCKSSVGQTEAELFEERGKTLGSEIHKRIDILFEIRHNCHRSTYTRNFI